MQINDLKPQFFALFESLGENIVPHEISVSTVDTDDPLPDYKYTLEYLCSCSATVAITFYNTGHKNDAGGRMFDANIDDVENGDNRGPFEICAMAMYCMEAARQEHLKMYPKDSWIGDYYSPEALVKIGVISAD